jgi:predicted nucleotidyltransferase
MTTARIPIPYDAIAAFCRRWHITELALFGSVLRDDFRPDSDIDVLVEFEPGHVPGFDFIRLEDELSRLFGGRRVDVVRAQYLNRWIRDRVLAGAELVYAER